LVGLSPGRPLGAAPVPMLPCVEVLGTPGWLTPLVLLPVVLGVDGAMARGVAGETPGEPGAAPGTVLPVPVSTCGRAGSLRGRGYAGAGERRGGEQGDEPAMGLRRMDSRRRDMGASLGLPGAIEGDQPVAPDAVPRPRAGVKRAAR